MKNVASKNTRTAKIARKSYSASRTRKVKVPNTNTSVLTVTSKMPSPSYSLPAHKACPNANGSICENCYAGKGCYQYRAVVEAQNTRFDWTRKCMQSPEGIEEFVSVMVAAISYVGVSYFRGHDSGDFFSVQYVKAWTRICAALPDIKFWFPTREWQSKASTELLPVLNPRIDSLRALAALSNVTLRPSALNVGDEAPVVAGFSAGSTVNNPAAFSCMAPSQNGECRDCRFCWDAPEAPVSYNLH